MLKLALCSDLHLEFADINLQNTEGADVLILAGDIMLANDLHDHPLPATPYTPEIIKLLGSRQAAAQRYRDFISRVSTQFPHVIAIAGNHEHYHGKWIQGIETLRAEYGRFSNVHFLESDTVVIDGVRFIGATLWTDVNRGDPLTMHALTSMMNDYSVIRHDGLGYTKLKPYHTAQRHRESVDYFKLILRDNRDQPTVVVGHHAPSVMSIHDDYRRDTVMNGAYYSDLSELILDNPQIKVWCHGHVHNPFDYHIGDTRIVCNPRGYPGERSTPFALQYIEI